MLRQLLIVALLSTPAIITAKTAHQDNSHKTTIKKIKIEKVRFIGNHKLSSDELSENLINRTPKLGILGGELKRDALKTDAMIIRDTYYQHGYLDVLVDNPKVTIDSKTGKAIITHKIIREGLPYKVSSVRISTFKNVDRNDLTKEIKLKKGEIFNVETLRQDLRSITKRIGSKGYPFAKVAPKFLKNSKNKTITVVYVVLPGKKGTINDIIIKGNKKTKESVIRSYITLAPGDQYNLSDLLDAQNQLMRTGFFKSATIRPVPARNGKVNLVVNVEEDKTGEIMGAGGYDSLEGLFVEGSFSEKNLMGTGITLGISASYSKMKKNGTLFFDDPRVAGTLFGLYGGIFYTTTDDSLDTYGYDKLEKGGYIGIRRQLTSELSGSIDYNYNDVSYSDINTSIYPDGLEDYTKSSIGLSLKYNSTDNFHTPRKGIYAKARIEYAGLGSSSKLAKYIKTSLKFAAYYGLKEQTGYDLILRYKMQANYIKDNGFIPEAEKLHIGGYYYGVRGYRSASINPKYDKHGGTKSLVNSVEASIPLSEKQQIRLTGFADYGYIADDLGNSKTKKSIGAQLEWRSPFGDVNFILAKAIDAEPEDDTTSFEFTIGKEF